MANIAESYSPKNNFWEYFPQFTAAEPFSKLWRSDKSPEKRISSTKMWAIALAFDPTSEIFNLPGKLDKIKDSFRKNEKVDVSWDELEEIKQEFIESRLQQTKRSLIAWNERMWERDEFLKQQKYSLDYYSDEGKLMRGNAEQLDRMAANTSKLYDEFFKIEKALSEEAVRDKNKSSTRVESLSDGGVI